MKVTPFIITCIPRSGGTLLGAILNTHSMIAMFNEPWFLIMIPKYGSLKIKINLKFIIADLMEAAEGFGCHLDDEFHQKVIKEIDKCNEDKDYYVVLHEFMKVFANSQGKMVWGIKQPLLQDDIYDVLHRVHDLKIIHIIRDPRSTVALRLGKENVNQHNLKGVLRFSRSWKKHIEFYQNNFSKSQNYYSLKYEEFVLNPDKYVKEICNFLCVSYEDQMNKWYSLNNSYYPKDINGNDSDNHRDIRLPVHHNGISIWKKCLSSEEIKIVEIICRDEMIRNDYNLLNENITISRPKMIQAITNEKLYNLSRNIKKNIIHKSFHFGRRAYYFLLRR